MKNYQPRYLIYDARYRTDEQRAVVLATADELEEAITGSEDYGDAVIVDSLTGQIVEGETP